MVKTTFIKKNTIMCICICILLILMVMTWFILYKNKESFEEKVIKDTDYLAPATKPITEDEWNILYNKMMKTYPEFNMTLEKVKEYTNFVTKEEINYYLKNNKFPWSNHVTTRFTELMSKDTGDSENKNKKKIDPVEMVNNMIKMIPNRYAYKQYITSIDMKEDLASDPYLIYTGEKPVPVEEEKKI
jgi:hypothetical protein